MPLPTRPPLSNPIPNGSFPTGPRQYIVNGPYWPMLIGDNLEVDSEGALTYPDGTGTGDDSVVLTSAWWPMAIGSGLTIDEDGKLTTQP